MDGTHASDLAAAAHTHPGTDITSQVPFERLPAGTGADQVAVGDHGHAGALARITYGTVFAGKTATIEIPNWLPFTLSLGSGWPDYGGVAFLQGMENDRYVGATYMKYNGDGTSGTGGAECGEAGTGTLLTFGSWRLRLHGELSRRSKWRAQPAQRHRGRAALVAEARPGVRRHRPEAERPPWNSKTRYRAAARPGFHAACGSPAR